MIIPDFLQPGDHVGIIATANKVDKDRTLQGIETLKSWGLKVKLGMNLFNSFNQFSGTDEERSSDLQSMIDDHEIKALFMARGGYGSSRIIDQINFEALKTYPKWICGFSDITIISLHLYQLGMASMHSPMPAFFHTTNTQSMMWFKDLIFGEKHQIFMKAESLNRKGVASGLMVGGNLALICHAIGSVSEIQTKGNILFIEDVGEQLYNVDRMMLQLKRAGLLNDLAGLVVGQFSESADKIVPFGKDAYEIIHDHVNEFDYPMAFNFPIGHTEENFAIPVGLPAELKVEKKLAVLNLDR